MVDKFWLDRKGKEIILRMGRREVFHTDDEGNSQKAEPISIIANRFNLIDKPRGTDYDQSLNYRRWRGYSQLL